MTFMNLEPVLVSHEKRVENEAAEKKKKALMPPSSSPDCIDNNIRKNTASFC